MATLLFSRGACKLGSICNRNSFLKGHQMRFYAKALKRQAIRVLSIKEANDLAKRPRNSATCQEIPKPDRSLPLLSSLQKPIPPVARTNTGKISGDSLQSNTLGNSSPVEEDDDRQVKVEKKRRGQGKSKRKSDEWVTLPDDVKYEKLDAGDKRFGPVVMEAKLSKDRKDRKSTILLEGRRLVAEGVAASLQVKSIYFTDVELLVGLALQSLVARGTKLYKVSSKHMRVWSDTVAPSGLMAICAVPEVKVSLDEGSPPRLPVTVICDRISDAGSLGTLIRSAAAAGCSKVLVTRGSVDPWEPKVLRSGMGAHFHIPIITTGWELIANYLPSNSDLYLVTNTPPPSSDDEEERPPSKIPRSILQKVLVESRDAGCPPLPHEEASLDESYLKRKELKIFQRLRLPFRSYETVNYASSNGETNIGLIVGSDDDGWNAAEAKRFSFSHGGQMVFVPGANGLSQAITSSVVLYEIRRQLKLRNSSKEKVSSNV